MQVFFKNKHAFCRMRNDILYTNYLPWVLDGKQKCDIKAAVKEFEKHLKTFLSSLPIFGPIFPTLSDIRKVKFNFHINLTQTKFTSKELIQLKKDLHITLKNFTFKHTIHHFKYSLTLTKLTNDGFEILMYDNFKDAINSVNFGKYTISSHFKDK